MMEYKYLGASKYVQSLDGMYYLFGQETLSGKAVADHTSLNKQEIDLQVGDVIYLKGHQLNGYSKGTNTRTGETGLYPSWKVKELTTENH